MSPSPFDAIKPIVSPPLRPGEPVWRSGESAPGFAPALAQAYHTDRTQPALQESPNERPADDDVQDSALDLQDGELRDNAAAAAQASTEPRSPDAAPESDQSVRDDDQDAVELSEDAAAAATIDQQGAAAEARAALAIVLEETSGAEVVAALTNESGGADSSTSQPSTPKGDDAQGDGSGGASTVNVEPLGVEAGDASPVATDGRQEATNRGLADIASNDAGVRHSIVDSVTADAVQPSEAPHLEDAVAIGPVEDAGDKPTAKRQVAQASRSDDASQAAAQSADQAIESAVIEASKVQGADDRAVGMSSTAVAVPTVVESEAAPAASDRAASALDRLSARAMRNTEKSESSDSGPHVDRARFIQRVEGAIRAAQQRDGKIQVRLSPPELGNLRIELAVQNGVMTAKLEAESPAARNILLDSLPQLRERLAQQDIRVEKFDVDVRRDGGNASQHGAFEQSGDRAGNDRQENRPRTMVSRISATRAGRQVGNGVTSDTALDVRI